MDVPQVLRSALSVLLLAVGCGAPRGPLDGAGASEAAYAPEAPVWIWPREFQEPALLVADKIVIVGPQGLLNHFVGRQSEAVEYTTKATERGLEQRFNVVSDGGSIRAALDEWQLGARRQLIAVERPDHDGPVRIEASGAASWQRGDGSGRREKPAMVFTAQPIEPGP